MTRNNGPGEVICGDAVHALEPLAPLVRVHPREDNRCLLLRVAPLACEVGDLLRRALEVALGGRGDDDEWLMWRFHDILEVVGVELEGRWETVVEEL